MPTGTVKFFNAEKGYAFIEPDDGGEDGFVHVRQLRGGKTGVSRLNGKTSS